MSWYWSFYSKVSVYWTKSGDILQSLFHTGMAKKHIQMLAVYIFILAICPKYKYNMKIRDQQFMLQNCSISCNKVIEKIISAEYYK